MNAPPNHPGKNARNNGEIKLHETSICPGITLGRIHVVDVDISIPQNRVDAGRISSELKRYTQAVESAKQHLRNHVASMHPNSSLEARAIFDIHATRDILSAEVSTK